MKRYRVSWNNGISMYVLANNEIEAMWKVQRERSSYLENIRATQVDGDGSDVESHTGILYMTVWNTEALKDYQGHSIVELRDNIKSEHTRKAAHWIVETLGEGDHRCIVKVDLVGEDVSFELIDSKTLEG